MAAQSSKLERPTDVARAAASPVAVPPEHPQTPAFVVDEPLLDDLRIRFQRAMAAHWSNSILGYSFKTNALPWLLAYYRDHGAWAEVVSDTEYELAVALEFAPDRIVFNGPAKGRERLRSALEEGAVVNLDAKREVTWAAELATERPDLEISVGVRVNWDLARLVPGELISEDEVARFGFNLANGEFDAAVAELREAGVRIAGLHMHNNTKSKSLEVYRAAARAAADVVTSRGLSLDWIDIGGGFFGGVDVTPTFDDYFAAIRDELQHAVDPEKTTLIVEPGGCLVAVPFEYHATVIDVKDVDETRFVVIDGSRTDTDPLFRRTRPYELSVTSASARTFPVQKVVGATLTEFDRVTALHDERELQVGDRLVFSKLGAYTLPFKGLFIDYLPSVYVRDGDGVLTQVRRKWGAREFLQANVWSHGDGSLRGQDQDSTTDASAPPAGPSALHPQPIPSRKPRRRSSPGRDTRGANVA
jgi:diaminopimelate decarboxylase